MARARSDVLNRRAGGSRAHMLPSGKASGAGGLSLDEVVGVIAIRASGRQK